MPDTLVIYTDGGCTGNPGPGGWGAVLLTDPKNPLELSGGESSTTNNRMEMTAVIRALTHVLENLGSDVNIELHTDSQYVRKGISQWMKGWIFRNWKTASGSPVKNKDLWLQIKELDDKLHVDWRWVKGHAGEEWNERCDQLAAGQRVLY